MVFFFSFYSSGIGNAAWLSSELFPIEVRSMGTMMMSMTCWGTNIIVASTFLTQMENITPSGAFGFYAAICILGWFCIYLLVLSRGQGHDPGGHPRDFHSRLRYQGGMRDAEEYEGEGECR
jgi:hypothetical protein